MKLGKLVFGVGLSLFLLSPYSHAIAEENAVASKKPIMIYSQENKPLALIGLEEIAVNTPENFTGCGNHVGLFEVDEIAHDGVSEIVGGVRVRPVSNDAETKAKGQTPFLMRITTDELPNVDISWLPTLVQKNNVLLIAYIQCGSGGLAYARDIYKADSLEW